MAELSIHKVQRYGWIADLPDQRDLLYAAPAPFQKEIPPSVDLTLGCPPVYDQGTLGSCTANAIAAAIEFDQKKLNLAEFTPSRLFIYYNERTIEHTVASDSGAFEGDLAVDYFVQFSGHQNPTGCWAAFGARYT